jgi:hypothetical protein
VEASGESTYRAYATDENADLGGSGFVGHVELRGARGMVWLHGDRISTERRWAHAGGRVLGVMFWIWWYGWAWYTFNTMRDLRSPGRRARFGETADGRFVWLTTKTRPETVSWPVAQSRLVLNVPVANTRISKDGAGVIQLEVPLGPKGRMAQLHLEVTNDKHDALMGVLSGRA